MRLTARTLAVALPVVFILGIAGSMASGYWSTEASKVPAVYVEGEAEGQYNPADIRGSYSFGDVETAFGVPAEVIARAFGFEEAGTPQRILAKDLEDRFGVMNGYEVGTDSVRLFVARYLDLPFEPEDDTGLPAQALLILRNAGVLTPAQESELADRSVDLSGNAAVEESDEVEPSEPEEDRSIRGNTTFATIYEWGAPPAVVAEVLGMEPGPRGMVIRDFCMQHDIEFSSVKDRLQAVVDAAAAE